MPSVISKLVKVESLQEIGSKMHIQKGDVNEGFFEEWPEVGKPFLFITPIKMKLNKSDEEQIFDYPMQTSVVTEVCDSRVFKTRNSVYRIITIDDERDNKIKRILT